MEGSNPMTTERSFERVAITPGNVPTVADYDAALAEIERLARDLKIQKAVVELAYLPHQQLTASNDKLRQQLTAREQDVAAEVRAREILKQHIHDLTKYATHENTCDIYALKPCDCGFSDLMKKGIAR
jgi:hypothetical protein